MRCVAVRCHARPPTERQRRVRWAVYDWPQTFVGFWYCTNNAGCSNGQGAYFVEQALKAPTSPDLLAVNCVGGSCHGEGVWTDPSALALMKKEALAQLVPRHA